MFNLEKAILEWRRRMAAGGVRDAEVLAEFEAHLREDMEQLLGTGLDATQAFQTAVRRIGPAGALREEFAKVGATNWLRKLKRILPGFLLAPARWFAPEFAALPVSLERFTPDAKHSLELARAEAAGFHHHFVGTEHLLLALLNAETGGVNTICRQLNLGRAAIRTEIERVVGHGPIGTDSGDAPFTPRARRAMALAAREAKVLRHGRISTEHLFLGLLLEGGGVAALVLKNLGVKLAEARAAVAQSPSP